MIDESLGFKLSWFNFHVGLSSFFLIIIYFCVFNASIFYDIDIVSVRNRL